MNALYASADGDVLDTVGGVDDLKAGRVRFVGDPVTRIREDYLRILRLFRFHAWYGKGEIDGEALRAAASEKAGLKGLSGERVQKEMLRLLEAPDPMRSLRAMAATGILVEVLPGALNLPRLERLVAIDADNFFIPDAVLRLAALLSQNDVRPIIDKLRLSNQQRDRLTDLCDAQEKIVSYLSIKEVRKLLYLARPRAVQGSRVPQMGRRFEGFECDSMACIAGAGRFLATAALSADGSERDGGRRAGRSADRAHP